MRAQWVCSRERRIALYKRSSIINQSINIRPNNTSRITLSPPSPQPDQGLSEQRRKKQAALQSAASTQRYSVDHGAPPVTDTYILQWTVGFCIRSYTDYSRVMTRATVLTGSGHSRCLTQAAVLQHPQQSAPPPQGREIVIFDYLRAPWNASYRSRYQFTVGVVADGDWRSRGGPNAQLVVVCQSECPLKLSSAV